MNSLTSGKVRAEKGARNVCLALLTPADFKRIDSTPRVYQLRLGFGTTQLSQPFSESYPWFCTYLYPVSVHLPQQPPATRTQIAIAWRHGALPGRQSRGLWPSSARRREEKSPPMASDLLCGVGTLHTTARTAVLDAAYIQRSNNK